MRRFILPLVLLAASVVLYLVFFTGDSEEARQVTPDKADAGEEDTSSELLIEELPAAEAGADSAQAESTDQRTAANEDADVERIVTGKVAVASACSTDGDLKVYAWSREVAQGDWQYMSGTEVGASLGGEATLIASTAVNPDMNFRLEMKTDLEEVYLYVRGRFAYSQRGELTKLTEQETEAYLMTACGARIEGTISGVGGEDPELIDVTLALSNMRIAEALGADTGFEDQATHPGPDGSFVLSALPVGLSYEVRVEPSEMAPDLADVERLSGGETQYVTFNLIPSSSVSGSVVGPDGAPLEGVKVRAAGGRSLVGIGGWVNRKVWTDSEGQFSIGGLPSGGVLVAAEHDDYLTSGFQTLELYEGEARGGVVFELSEGNSIEGGVRWPDGEPVANAEIVVEFDRASLLGADSINAMRGGFGNGWTDADGQFKVTSLGLGPFTVTAFKTPEGARFDDWIALETELNRVSFETDDQRDASYRWSDRVGGVVPGQPALVFVLAAPEVLAGRVIDDAGAPVPDFEMIMVRLEDSLLGDLGSEKRDMYFMDPEGRFFYPGLSKGRWRAYASAAGYATSAPTDLTIPRPEDAEPLLITIEPSSTVGGTVLTPLGSPVANAQLSVNRGTLALLSSVSEDLKDPATTSDASGQFLFEELRSGSLKITASADGYAPSNPETLTLTAGSETLGLRLSLRSGGTITGLLYDKEGSIAPNAVVQVLMQPLSSTQISETDSEGAFRFDNLEPGTWQVIGIPNLLGAADGSESQGGRAQLMKNMQMSMVVLEDGGEEHVVLGAPPTDPVTLSGTVRHLGEPVPGAIIVFMIAGESTLPKTDNADAAGRYSTRLDKAGTYLLTVQRVKSANYQEMVNNVFVVTVPKTVEHHHDIDLPGAGIKGRVMTEDGAALEGVPIKLEPSPGAGYSQISTVSMGQIFSSEDGSFSFEGVRPGEYLLRAGGANFMKAAVGTGSTESVSFGQVTLDLVLSEDEVLEDVKLVVEEPGKLQVKVLDTFGAPVSGAYLFIREEGGQPVEPFAAVTTDVEGVAVYPGLAEGNYQVSARTMESATVEGATVHVDAGATELIELQMDKGTLLNISMTDSEGDPVNAKLRVVDSDGREHASYASIAMQYSLMGTHGFSGSRLTVGPLPPGKYRVYATTEDGRETKKPVSLRGQPERSIKLRFR